MVLAAAGVEHAAGADDDGGAFEPIECLAFLDLTDVGQVIEAERVIVGQHIGLQLGVVAFGVGPEDAGGVHG